MSPFSTTLWMLLGLFGGASLVVQASLNAGLRERLQSIAWAGFVSYLGGTLAMVIALAVARVPLRLEQARSVPVAWWFGGLFGAAYLAIAIVLLPRLGAATVVALVIAGQLASSLLFDHFGWFGLPVQAMDLRRATGALLLVAGVVLMRP
jgi:bacterial/archaeal transporter family-2 protein